MKVNASTVNRMGKDIRLIVMEDATKAVGRKINSKGKGS